MKKFMTALLCGALCLALGAAAAETTLEIDGVVQPAKTVSILAPYSGRVGDMTVAAGDALAAGSALLNISTTKIYADFDGAVTGVFAQPGDSAAWVQGRYGALLWLEEETLYSAACSINGADSDVEDKIVHVGETVYVRATNNNKHEGVARVTSVFGKDYTLDITLVDDLEMNESIRVYRESDYDVDSCIGTGKVSRIDPVAISSEGYVLAVHVQDGDSVARGDLLLEVVPDALEGRVGGDGSVKMPEDGVLLSVGAAAGAQIAKDAVLATYCPAGALELVCAVDEQDLKSLAVGDKMKAAFDALDGEAIGATVTKIASAADENGAYAVTLVLESTEDVRIGMSATVEK